jgi:hypothetical protein
LAKETISVYNDLQKVRIEVGRIISSSTTRFSVGCRVLRPQVPTFGSLVKVGIPRGDEIMGLIYDVRVEDDPFVRQMAANDALRPEMIEDQRQNRQIPIEVSVLVIGYGRGPRILHHLPPQPPVSLDVIHTCTRDELLAFTAQPGYFGLVLDSTDLPSDELLAAHIRYAAEARGGGRDYLLASGRELARLLALDPARLDGMLRRIRP